MGHISICIVYKQNSSKIILFWGDAKKLLWNSEKKQLQI